MILEEYDEAKQRELDRRDGYEDGKTEGKIEGKAEGKAEEKRKLYWHFLTIKGGISQSVREKILSEKDTDKLTSWLETAYRASPTEEFLTKLACKIVPE